MVSAWSIGTGKRSNLQKGINVPGAGTYTPDKKQKQNAPSWKIGTSQRVQMGLNNSPGPGAYNLKNMVALDAFKYTMRPKTGVKQPNENTPGSGSYDPKIYSQFKKSVAYSMALKSYPSEGRLVVPGPGAYNYGSTVQNRPTYKFGKDTNRDFYYLNRSPGPGTYRSDGRPTSASAPRYGFGTSMRDGFYIAGKFPGPGQYDLKTSLDSFYSKHATGITMISRRANLDQEYQKRVPGPGAYEPKLYTKRSNPAFKIGTSQREQLSKSYSALFPGAGAYNTNFNDRQKSPAYRMGTDVRKALTDTITTPGPGTYYLPQRGVEGPRYSFKGVMDNDAVMKERIRVPGAGTYNPSMDLIKQRPSSAKIGTAQQRATFQNTLVPGPGNYELNPKAPKEGPKWGFGSELQRPGGSSKFTPGPGAYSLKPTFADVPKYLIPHSQSTKYL